MLYSRSLLFTYFIYGNMYILVPDSQFIPLPLILWEVKKSREMKTTSKIKNFPKVV